jgi:hypothetical protein
MSDSTHNSTSGSEPTASLATTPAGAEPEKPTSSQRTVIVLASIGIALLVAIIVLLIVFLSSRDDTPPLAVTDTPSPTPTETSPTPEPTPSTEPPASTGHITSYTVHPESVTCASGTSSVPITFDWEADGTALYFGVGTDNAKTEPYDSYPTTYSLDFDYQCGQPDKQQIYTISVEQANGDLESQTLTVTEVAG